MTPMFTKEEGGEVSPRGPVQNAETIIGPTVKVEGTFESDDNIQIEGQVVGTIKTSKDLTVGTDAKIEADVTAVNMHISGEVRGNIHASGTVELMSSARIHGDIETQIISVQTGAVVQGRCSTGTSTSTEGEENTSTDDLSDD